MQYDPSNAIVAGDDPIALLRAVADRVVSMHASDRYLAEGTTLDDLRQTDGTLGYSPNLRHGVTGKGLNDYDAIFRILAEHRYHGWVSIEDGMNGMDEMAESLAFLRADECEVLSRGLTGVWGRGYTRRGEAREVENPIAELRELYITGRPDGEYEVGWLAESLQLSTLSPLTARGLWSDALARFFASPHLSRLKALRLPPTTLAMLVCGP